MRMVHPFVLAALAGWLGAAAAPQGRALERLKWLAGCWEMRRGATVTVEMWMAPDANLMLGAGRAVANGIVRESEQLSLSWTGDSLVYHAIPSGQAPADFKGGAPTDSGFTVANLGHDFPQRITYRKRGADSLVTRIEGPGSNGVRGIDYPMRRVACTG
ncbi:MAG TPA: DUF6265 family protein [Gemmatimonadales bacterium]|nr:DUF6265 family protein [Gemmatimonadales bacterium]